MRALIVLVGVLLAISCSKNPVKPETVKQEAGIVGTWSDYGNDLIINTDGTFSLNCTDAANRNGSYSLSGSAITFNYKVGGVRYVNGTWQTFYTDAISVYNYTIASEMVLCYRSNSKLFTYDTTTLTRK